MKNENEVKIVHVGEKQANIKFNDYNFVATCKFLEFNEDRTYRYCQWTIKQKDWIKGMITWGSGTYLVEDKGIALEQTVEKMAKSMFQVQDRLF